MVMALAKGQAQKLIEAEETLDLVDAIVTLHTSAILGEGKQVH